MLTSNLQGMALVHGQRDADKPVAEDVIPSPGNVLVHRVHRMGAAFRTCVAAGAVMTALVDQTGTVVKIEYFLADFSHISMSTGSIRLLYTPV